MFDQSLNYKLVQIRNNKVNAESFLQEFIYRFYRHNKRCCIKYVVSIKIYPQGLLTLDYYPKINLTPSQNSLNDIRDLRYQMLTKQNSFGVIGGTILDIMQDVRNYTDADTWGFLAANLPNEITNENNKRYQVYKKVLSRTFIHEFQIYGNNENSAIFVIPVKKVRDKETIIQHYEQIFAETN